VSRDVPDVEDEVVYINDHPLAVDDYIKVLPTRGNKTSFIGRVKGWWIKDGAIVTIDVWGGSKGREQMRSLRVDQVEVLSTRKQNTLRRTKQ